MDVFWTYTIQNMLLGPSNVRIVSKSKALDINEKMNEKAPRLGGGVLHITTYTRRLRPKGVPFLVLRYNM